MERNFGTDVRNVHRSPKQKVRPHPDPLPKPPLMTPHPDPLPQEREKRTAFLVQ